MALQVVPPSRTACPRLPSGRVTPLELVGMPGESEGACPVLPCLSLFAAISSEAQALACIREPPLAYTDSMDPHAVPEYAASRARRPHVSRRPNSALLSGTDCAVRSGRPGTVATQLRLNGGTDAHPSRPLPFNELKRGLRMAALLGTQPRRSKSHSGAPDWLYDDSRTSRPSWPSSNQAAPLRARTRTCALSAPRSGAHFDESDVLQVRDARAC